MSNFEKSNAVLEPNNRQEKEESTLGSSEKAQKLMNQIGLDWKILPENFKRILEKMDAWGHLESSMRMNRLVEEIIEDENVKALIPKEQKIEAIERNVKQASTLSDIGKRGPIEATEEQSEFITKIFSIHNISNRETLKIHDFVVSNLKDFKTPAERIKILDSLTQYGIRRDMSMLEFYNLHTPWSLSILEKEPISKEVLEGVARHHTLNGVKIIKGELTLEDKLVILLDKYDARRKRGKESHDEAITRIGDKIQKSEFRDDKEFKTLLEALERLAPSMETYK